MGREREERRSERGSGQGMLVGSLMLLAMHAPYGSDQISDRLPSPSSLCRSATAKWTALLELVYSDARKLLSRLPRVFPSLPFRSILNYRLTNAPSRTSSLRTAFFLSHHIPHLARDRDIRARFVLFPSIHSLPDNFLNFSPGEKETEKKEKKTRIPVVDSIEIRKWIRSVTP